MRSVLGAAVLAMAFAACGAGSSGIPVMQLGSDGNPPSGGTVTVTPTPLAGATSTPTPSAGLGGATPTAAPTSSATAPAANAAIKAPSGFTVATVGTVAGPRELAALPNGDLIVGTSGTNVIIIPNAEAAGAASASSTFTTIADGPVQGVAYGSSYVFVATQHGVYRVPYTTGAKSGTATKIASVRTGSVAPNSDGDVHTTSSIAVSGSTLYVGVGSSCNACTETDPTRATVQKMGLDGSGMTTQATRWRNAMAMATDSSTGNVWAGGAGQDNLAASHPYEFMDAVSSHPAGSDYGWPACEENHVAYTSGADCSAVIVPALEFPAYSTIIGAAFYPTTQTGTYVFPSAYRGGMFAGIHGSWHATNNIPDDPPHVAFVPFANGKPSTAVNWSDPTKQWSDFLNGFQNAAGTRIGRPTGVAVGAQGSLFVADDQTGTIYRIRPTGP